MNALDTYNILTSVSLLKKQLESMSGVQIKKQIKFIKSSNLYNIYATDIELKKITKKLFNDGHHARAVEEGFKFLNNLVKKKSGFSESDGSALMKKVFSAKSPLLKLNAGVSESEKNEQLGYMEILSGCMIGIRNPRAHEHDWEDSEMRALQLLSLANHLIIKVKLSKK